MCCHSGSHPEMQRWSRPNACFCGCDEPPYLRPRFITKEQRIAGLEKHLADLREEVKGVEEHIARIKKEK